MRRENKGSPGLTSEFGGGNLESRTDELYSEGQAGTQVEGSADSDRPGRT